MATISPRRNRDGSRSWDVAVRRTGHPTACKTFRTKLEAELWAARLETRMAGRTSALARDMTFAELLDEGLPRLRNPVDAAFAYWREALGTLRLCDLTPSLIARHRDLLLGAPTGGHRYKKLKPRSNPTVRNYLLELSRLLTYAVKELHVMETNPVENVKKPPASAWRVRFLSDDERTALLAACKGSDSPDLYVFVLFCLTTGCRKGEAQALEWKHVDLVRRWAVFPTTKNGTARGVPLTQAVAEMLRVRPRVGDLVFPLDITSAWDTAVKKAGIADFRFHDLRHTTGSTLTMNGANAVEVATLLGHKTLDMVKRYSHLSGTHTVALVDRVMGVDARMKVPGFRR
jgi:integrase